MGLHGKQIAGEQPVIQARAASGQGFDAFVGLNRGDEGRQRADDTEDLRFRQRLRFGEKAAVSGASWVQVENRYLSMESLDAAIYIRNPQSHRQIVHQVAGLGIVAPIHDNLAIMAYFQRIFLVQESIDCHDFAIRIEVLQAFPGAFRLGLADLRCPVQDLALQIAFRYLVGIDQCQFA